MDAFGRQQLKGAGTGAAAGAATGALVGSVVPGVGTAVGAGAGALVGGIGGYLAQGEKPTEVAKFSAPEYTSGTGYSGAYDPVTASSQQVAADKAAGIQRFDPSAYMAAGEQGLRAQVDEGVRKERANQTDSGAARGFANSGTMAALDNEAIGRGERTYALGVADLEKGAAGLGVQEENNIRNAGLEGARANLQNEQFGSEFGEKQRETDNAARYGEALDTYQLNSLDPAQRKDALAAARTSNTMGIYNGMVSAGGSIIGAKAAKG